MNGTACVHSLCTQPVNLILILCSLNNFVIYESTTKEKMEWMKGSGYYVSWSLQNKLENYCFGTAFFSKILAAWTSTLCLIRCVHITGTGDIGKWRPDPGSSEHCLTVSGWDVSGILQGVEDLRVECQVLSDMLTVAWQGVPERTSRPPNILSGGHRQNKHEHQKHTQGEDEKDRNFGMQLPEGSGTILTVTGDTPGYRLGARQVCNGHGNKCE